MNAYTQYNARKLTSTPAAAPAAPAPGRNVAYPLHSTQHTAAQLAIAAKLAGALSLV